MKPDPSPTPAGSTHPGGHRLGDLAGAIVDSSADPGDSADADSICRLPLFDNGFRDCGTVGYKYQDSSAFSGSGDGGPTDPESACRSCGRSAPRSMVRAEHAPSSGGHPSARIRRSLSQVSDAPSDESPELQNALESRIPRLNCKGGQGADHPAKRGRRDSRAIGKDVNNDKCTAPGNPYNPRNRALSDFERGGQWQGRRLLNADAAAPAALMITDQLPSEAFPIGIGRPRPGVGFGFGFSVRVHPNPATSHDPVSRYGWSGAHSTHAQRDGGPAETDSSWARALAPLPPADLGTPIGGGPCGCGELGLAQVTAPSRLVPGDRCGPGPTGLKAAMTENRPSRR